MRPNIPAPVPLPALPRGGRWLWVVLALFVWALPIGGTIALRNVCMAAMIGGYGWLLWQQRKIPDLPLHWPWLSYAAIAALSVLFALDPRYSLEEIKSEILLPFLLFGLMANLIRDEASFLRLLTIIAAGNVFLVAFSIATAACGGTTKDGLVGSLNSGVGHYSTYLIAVLPFLVFLAFRWWQQLGQRHGIFVGGLVIASVVSLYFTANRQSFVTLFVELLAAACLLSVFPAARRYWYLLAIPALAIGGIFVVLYLQRDPSAAAGLGKAMQGDTRWEAWRMCIDQLLANPWQGGGFGHRTFQFLHPEFAARSPFWHAHNMVLNKGVQMGVPGILAFLLLYGAVLVQMGRGLRIGRPEAAIAAAGIVMAAGMFAKNMTDDFFYRESSSLFWLLSGAVIGVVRGCRTPGD